jgi:hypothetical protein
MDCKHFPKFSQCDCFSLPEHLHFCGGEEHMNNYEFELSAMCPVHAELTDVYMVTIRTAQTIPVEDILTFCERYKKQQIMQEDMTKQIAVGLGVHVTTVGMHAGVKVTCEEP